MSKTSDFKQGDHVLYVPHHAEGNSSHPSCERGVVSSVSETVVFVKYYHFISGEKWPPIETGDEPYTAAGTEPEMLTKVTEL